MFYVYVYKDPRPTKNQQPVYVGKGTGDRDLSHWSRGSHNKPLQDFLSHLRGIKLEPICIRVFETESEEEAFAKEVELIKLYGRRDLKTGSLFNRTDGGEGASGAIRTEEEKINIGRFSKENWQEKEFRDRVVASQIAAHNTPEALALKSKNSKELWSKQGDKMALAIKKSRSTDASRARTSAKSKEQWADPAYAEKQSANNKDIANRPEVKEAKSSKTKLLWADPVWRAKMLEARKFKKIK